MQFRSRERWRLRGQELKRQAFRWDAPREWGLVVISVAFIPVGLIGVLFAPGDYDRIGSALVVAVGVGVVLGVIWYLDRKIDKRANHRRDFPLP